jgi:predicted transcriptional regulator
MNPENENNEGSPVVDPNDILAGINRTIDEKNAKIAELIEDNDSLLMKASRARRELDDLRSSIKEFIIEGIENGEDKDLLRALADTTGIAARSEVTRRITIEATVEMEVDIFDEIDDYNFDFVITYEGDELHVQNSNIEVSD